MAVTALWHRADRAPCPACRARTAGTPTARHGRGLRWRVTVGDHPTRAFAIKADAEAWERHLRDAPPITDTISGLLDRWEAGKADLEPTSRAPIRLAAQRVRDRWGVLSPDQVERSAITAWLANLTAEHGPKRARVVKPAAHSTKIKALQALAGALDIAVDRGLIRANPARGIRIARDDRREAVVLDVGDVARLAARVTGYEPLVWLLATSGLRIGTNGRPIEINGQTGRKYAPYTTVDAGANYDLTETATLNAAVYNVLNEEIRESEFNTVLEGRRLWLVGGSAAGRSADAMAGAPPE